MKKTKEKTYYDSSLIKSSEYDFVTKELVIEFDNLALYKYSDVENQEYIDFSTADSPGREFARLIKPKQFTKLN
jgi:hypothetical protein